MCRDHGHKTDLFPDVKPLGEDTGEQFLSQHLLDQLERQESVPFQKGSPRCMCVKCGSNPISITEAGARPATAPAVGPEMPDLTPTVARLRVQLWHWGSPPQFSSSLTLQLKQWPTRSVSQLLHPLARQPSNPPFSQQSHIRCNQWSHIRCNHPSRCPACCSTPSSEWFHRCSPKQCPSSLVSPCSPP